MLRTVSVIFRVLGWASVVLGVLAAVLIWFVPKDLLTSWQLLKPESDLILSSLFSLIVGVFYGILFLAGSEGILVFLAIEENTRKVRDLLEKK